MYEFFARLSDAIRIPIMIQDAPVSGTTLSAAFLARMATEIDNVAYFKIETAGAASKIRELIRLSGDAIEGPWDGEEGITLLPDLDAGATGAMTGGAYPDGMRAIVDAHAAGDRERALALYQQWLPLINYENRQTGLLAAKALMREGGVISCEAPRHPFPAMHPDTRAGLIDVARRLLLDPFGIEGSERTLYSQVRRLQGGPGATAMAPGVGTRETPGPGGEGIAGGGPRHLGEIRTPG
jgi:4-hydroxy-tetrahydrodipicolinate synthase/2-keto-3-deoxy-L-arabinonate dehydratase